MLEYSKRYPECNFTDFIPIYYESRRFFILQNDTKKSITIVVKGTSLNSLKDLVNCFWIFVTGKPTSIFLNEVESVYLKFQKY